MATPSTTIFEETLKGLEAGLTVATIATFTLVCHDIDRDANALVSSSEHADMDAFPALKNGKVVGVLERGASVGVVVLLDESMIVAASMPIEHLLDALITGRPYRLVLTGNQITGIVTRSDLGKLPVRLYAFGVITHLESVMSAYITRVAPDDSWMNSLSPNRRNKCIEKRSALSRDRMDPALIECTEFSDKRDLVRKLGKYPKSRVDRELEPVVKLRNTIAHGSTIAATWDGVLEFVTTLSSARKWIAELGEQSTDPIA